MDDVAIDQYAEQLVRQFAHQLTQPRAVECLHCYVLRMLNEFDCDNTLRFAASYRDLRAPRATALEHRLSNSGAFCDCEIFMNGVRRAPELRADDASGMELEGVPLPACRGVRRGSTQACAHWVRRSRDPFGKC